MLTAVTTGQDEVPDISIITPCFRAGAFLERNILSVRDQPGVKVEHIVVDGGSQDETLSILQRHPDVRWISEPDRGQSEAFNKGLRLSRAPLVGWLNADDVYLPGVLAQVVAAFRRRPETMIVNAHLERVTADGELVEFCPAHSSAFWLRHFWFRWYGLNHPSTFYHRTVFEHVGEIDETLHYAMDYDFYLRASRHFEFTDLDLLTTRMLVHPDSKTSLGWSKFADDVRTTMVKVWKPRHRLFYLYSLFGIRCEEARHLLVDSYMAVRDGEPRVSFRRFCEAWERCPVLFLRPLFYGYLARMLTRGLLGARGQQALRRLLRGRASR